MAQLYPLKNTPSSIETLLRASFTGLKKAGKSLPDKGYTIEGLTIDKSQFKDYCKMFGFDESTVPSPYWYIRLFSLQTLLMAHPDSPFPMPGMVHLSCKINQFETIYPTDKLDVTCQFGKLIQHDKGTAIETITTLKRSGKVVWEQKNINLYLGKKGLGEADTDKPVIEITSPDQTLPWTLDTNLGFEYAKVSGDFNPIHLHAIGGKLFGFPRHLIHGWYSLSRAVAPVQSSLEGTHELYVSFKKPLFLPGQVLARTQEVEDSVFFDVINEKEGYPHLKGYIKKG
jgi:hypothetical protein